MTTYKANAKVLGLQVGQTFTQKPNAYLKGLVSGGKLSIVKGGETDAELDSAGSSAEPSDGEGAGDNGSEGAE